MKKFILLCMLALIISCVSYPNLEHIEESFMIDFRKYSNNDFLFTSGDYCGKYKSISMIDTYYFPELRILGRGETESSIDKDKYYLVGSKFARYVVEKKNYDLLINKMYESAKKTGADAVINIKIVSMEHPSLSYETIKQNPSVLFYAKGYVISGLSIKRLD